MTSKEIHPSPPLLLALLVLFLPGTVAAQDLPAASTLPDPLPAVASAGDDTGSAAARKSGPGSAELLPSSAGPLEITSQEELHVPGLPRLQPRSRGSVPLMAAGGTLLPNGALIGGDAGTTLTVGGAGVLAWGVYLHF